MDPALNESEFHKKSIIWRGFRGRCPRCGGGQLFKAYLKQVDTCSECLESFAHIRADDGPAWLSILVTGHLMLPLAIYLGMDESLPKWMALSILLVATLVAVLIILPRAKGIFVAVLWRIYKKRELERAGLRA